MKIEFLKEAKNLQELKSLYFKLAKKYHPDVNGGNLEIMKIINNEYDYLKTVLKNADNTERKHMENTESMEGFRGIIEMLIKYPKIKIEIVNKWLWISGYGTFAIKEDILYNTLHCRYSKAQKKFYWYEGIEGNNKKYKGGFLKKAIDKYGITVIESNNNNPYVLA
jgi:curved DNA-binding protein CbpA